MLHLNGHAVVAIRGEIDMANSFRHLCHLHSAVVGDAVRHSNFGDTLGVARAEQARSFRCEPHAPSAARRFVADTLRSWGREQLVDDASLVVSELATNAVVHAQSDFIVSLSTQCDAMRVSVRDASPVVPLLPDPPPTTVSGRGLILITAIARSWGTELVSDGKLVWAELRT